MIRNTSIIELLLVGVTLYLLKLLFRSVSNSFAVYMVGVMVLLAEGFMKLLGPSIVRLNNWFDSGREQAVQGENRRYS